MESINVRVKKIEKENSRLKGVASVLIDDSYMIHDIKIIEGDKGLFIAMPNKKLATGEYRDIAHPVNSSTRSFFEDAILNEYRNCK